MPGIVDFRTVLEDPDGGDISPSNPLPVSIDGVTIGVDTPIPVAPGNILGKFRESFETFVPGVFWNLTKASGDIVQVDGNAISASYLVISKDPLTAGTETYIDTIATFDMPVEISAGIHMSQRTIGQELSMEFISTDTPLNPFADVAISSISQSLTTLTVNTVTPHGLVPGKRIGIYGVSDSRLNYPAVVVATIPSATQFTVAGSVTATALPSVTAGPFTSGYVYFRPSMSYAQDGASQIFENAVATNASLYLRSNAGDSLPSGTATSFQAATVGSTASVQGVNAANTYAFLPTTEFRLNVQADRVQFYDSAVDATAITTNRLLRTQVVPSPSKKYKLRFKVVNDKGLTVPVAKIVSIVKSGTVVTVTTDVPHTLTTADVMYIYGVRDQTTFPNGTATITGVPTSTTFTYTSTTGSVSSFGGVVYRANGAAIPSGQGAISQVVQSASITNGILTVVGSGSWAGFVIGDYINIVGATTDTSGTSVGIDGVYRIRNFATTSLELEPIGTTTIPATLVSTNCGGAVIKRTDARISFVRIFDYLRERVEMFARPDAAAGISVNLIAGASVGITSGTVTTVSTLTSMSQYAGIPINTMPYDSQHNLWVNAVRGNIV